MYIFTPNSQQNVKYFFLMNVVYVCEYVVDMYYMYIYMEK